MSKPVSIAPASQPAEAQSTGHESCQPGQFRHGPPFENPPEPAPQDADAAEQLATSAVRRMAALVGRPCPRCGLPMVLAGMAARPRLVCQQTFGYGSLCCYSYSNAEAAEDELLPH